MWTGRGDDSCHSGPGLSFLLPSDPDGLLVLLSLFDCFLRSFFCCAPRDACPLGPLCQYYGLRPFFADMASSGNEEAVPSEMGPHPFALAVCCGLCHVGRKFRPPSFSLLSGSRLLLMHIAPFWRGAHQLSQQAFG